MQAMQDLDLKAVAERLRATRADHDRVVDSGPGVGGRVG